MLVKMFSGIRCGTNDFKIRVKKLSETTLKKIKSTDKIIKMNIITFFFILRKRKILF